MVQHLFLSPFSAIHLGNKEFKKDGDTQAKAKEEKIPNLCKVLSCVKKKKVPNLCKECSQVIARCLLFSFILIQENLFLFLLTTNEKKGMVSGGMILKTREKNGVKKFFISYKMPTVS